VYDNRAAVKNKPAFVTGYLLPGTKIGVFMRQKIKHIPVEAPHVGIACYGCDYKIIRKRGLLPYTKGYRVLPLVFGYKAGGFFSQSSAI